MNTTAISHYTTLAPAVPSITAPVEEITDLFYLDGQMSPLLAEDLSELPTAEVRRLCNEAFQEMDCASPREGAHYDYEILVEELHCRPDEGSA